MWKKRKLERYRFRVGVTKGTLEIDRAKNISRWFRDGVRGYRGSTAEFADSMIARATLYKLGLTPFTWYEFEPTNE